MGHKKDVCVPADCHPRRPGAGNTTQAAALRQAQDIFTPKRVSPTAAAKHRPRARAAHAACPAIEATCAPPHGAARRIPRSGLQRHGQPPWAGLPRVSLRSSPCALLCTPRWASPRHGGGACARQRGPAPRRAAPLPTPRVAGRRARGRLDKHHSARLGASARRAALLAPLAPTPPPWRDACPSVAWHRSLARTMAAGRGQAARYTLPRIHALFGQG